MNRPLSQIFSRRIRLGFVIPVHGSVPLVLETLDSIASQSVAPDVVVVVFDGPNREITEKVESHSVNPVVIENPRCSGGPATPRNMGMDHIRDMIDVVCFLDHDDIIHSDFVRVALDVLEEQPEASVLAFDFENWNHLDPRSDLPSGPVKPISTIPLTMSDYLQKTGSVLPSYSVIRKEVEPAVRDSRRFFDASFPSNQDFDSFVRILSQFSGVRCGWKAGWYRVISSSLSADGSLAWSCRARTCHALSRWFASKGDRANQLNFRRAFRTANRRAARHLWIGGGRNRALRILFSNLIRSFDPRDLSLIVLLILGMDAKSRGLNSLDQRDPVR